MGEDGERTYGLPVTAYLGEKAQYGRESHCDCLSAISNLASDVSGHNGHEFRFCKHVGIVGWGTA